MEEYFNSKKYMILLVFVCLLFTIITLKAFDYMPKPIKNTEYSEKDIQESLNNNSQFNDNTIQDSDDNSDIEDDDSDTDDEDEIEDSNYDKSHKTGHIDFTRKSEPNIQDLEEIPAPKGAYEENIEAYSPEE